MAWDEQRRRNAALDAVLAYTAAHPKAELPFAEMPGLIGLFGDARGLLLAAQERWNQLFSARMTQLAWSSPRPSGVRVRAWRECAAAEPVLRYLLDRHLPRLGDAALERVEMLVCA
jgi:hypothetical protein